MRAAAAQVTFFTVSFFYLQEPYNIHIYICFHTFFSRPRFSPHPSPPRRVAQLKGEGARGFLIGLLGLIDERGGFSMEQLYSVRHLMVQRVVFSIFLRGTWKYITAVYITSYIILRSTYLVYTYYAASSTFVVRAFFALFFFFAVCPFVLDVVVSERELAACINRP